MKKYWRIYHLINETLRIWKRDFYLEVGMPDGRNLRKVKARIKYATGSRVARDLVSHQWEMRVDDFLDLVLDDLGERYGVIFLREWDNANLEKRVLKLYERLDEGGLLIVEGMDENGRRNDAWRIAVGLQGMGVVTGRIKDYLLIYKSDVEIKRTIKSRMRLGTYLKRKEKIYESK